MAVFFISSCTNEEYAEDKTAKQNTIDSQQIQLACKLTHHFPLVLMEIAKEICWSRQRSKNLPLNQIINCSSLPGAVLGILLSLTEIFIIHSPGLTFPMKR